MGHLIRFETRERDEHNHQHVGENELQEKRCKILSFELGQRRWIEKLVRRQVWCGGSGDDAA